MSLFRAIVAAAVITGFVLGAAHVRGAHSGHEPDVRPTSTASR